ncbi:site-specific DNA-methyltransferase [Proteus sp. G2638]|uniref:site-specific DNA-methyltransferase n=1 Tax=unclassified Proteus (in: enterobacteria) TaxID=257482 RepID=UPI001376B703|nr:MULTISPECIES: site-specific DNA-methyltransferase [unclassified Proteus (in: enterobacteria)]HAU5529981.1 site-specific DNA-methyltransferase [Proteus mirabilis]NBN38925.1 site-specific DNA-methyltransferase [Proteus sp. G2638]NBN56483.1 site-specific DNA-methyltransferase [Proteus sp. G3927]HAU5551918.1 site-specific DNA-methyltransferase [Proteus mirabilis]HAU5567823.1 site-specific DNA-methyltransferase [Proteus mirabilis]
MDKLKMHSPDMTQQNIEKIQALFPNCVTESRGANGELKLAIDFDQLKQELSNSIVEGPQERYQLSWPGKRQAMLTANASISKTLRPFKGESVDFDTTKNLFIEGDNLDALKILQESYLNKVKLIYIDPPYNTGRDFVYADNFHSSSDEYLVNSNQKDSSGNALVTNTESNGRFHSDWLGMLYSRLVLSRRFLSEDGAIFISIDDGEVANLRKIADLVFGESNFIANVIWQKKYTRSNDARWFSDNHDHILCYAKNKNAISFNMLPRNDSQISAYSNPDSHPKGKWKATPLHAKSGTNTSSYTFKNGVTWQPPKGTFRRFNDESMRRMDEGNEIWFGSDGNQTPSRKSFLSEIKDGVTPVTIWPYDEVGHNHESNSELKKLDLGGLFTNPKPVRLIERILRLVTDRDSIVLDFFAGSSTTAHAVMKLNAEDGGNRKFIMVQLPEECDKKSEAFKTGYKTIAEISKERIRRAGAKILEGECHKDWNKDVGFRVLKVDSSNMADVYYSPDQVTQGSLDLLVDNIKADRTDEDLLFQVLLDWGVDLTLPIRKETIQGKSVFFVDDDALVACFDLRINEALIKELAIKEPLRVVFRDDGFESDAVKINAEQIFKQVSPHTEVKAI